MLTEVRIRQDLRPEDGIGWITTLRAQAIRKLLAVEPLPRSRFDQRDLAEITSEDYPGERLIVCRNPRLATERRHKREALLEATERNLQDVVKATGRARRPLRGEAAIGQRLGRVIGRHKMARHFETTITETGFSFRRREADIRAEAALDGIYVVRTNVEPERLSATETVLAYKRLSRVERVFRCLKSVDLKVRPIHHRRPDRVRAHVFLCMLAYYVEWRLRKALAPVLFEDHDRSRAEGRRDSVVAPARRSEAADAKAASKHTEDDLPVHGFGDLIENLGTLTMNTMSLQERQETFQLQSQPTRLQSRCFELLGVSPRM